jgi:hypothetical protein
MDSDKKTISTPSELADLTNRFVEQFCRQLAFPSTVDIRVERHQTVPGHNSSQVSTLNTTLKHQKLTLHLSEKELMGIMPLTLQGWLDMELARRQLELEPGMYRINFDREIRPLVTVAGAGVQLVRHLVMHLENSLKNLIAAHLVIEIGHSQPLLHALHHSINPSIAEKEDYQRLIPYHWIRALFLCNINKRFSPVALLADKGLGADLESYWWSCHAHILPEDKDVLKTLFRLSNQNPVKHFSETLVKMFKFVNARFLIR